MFGNTSRKYIQTPADPFALPRIDAMPRLDGDFLPEVHRARMSVIGIRHFDEPRMDKKSNTADAKQKRN